MDIEISLSIFHLTFSPGACVRSNHFSFLCRQWSPWSFTDGLPLGLAHCCFLDRGVSELASVSIGQSSTKHPRQIGQTGGFQLCKQGRKRKGNHLTGTRTKSTSSRLISRERHLHKVGKRGCGGAGETSSAKAGDDEFQNQRAHRGGRDGSVRIHLTNVEAVSQHTDAWVIMWKWRIWWHILRWHDCNT